MGLVEGGWAFAVVEDFGAGAEAQFVRHLREGLKAARGFSESEVTHVAATLWCRDEEALVGGGLAAGSNGHATEACLEGELPLAGQAAPARVPAADDPLENPFLDAFDRGLPYCHVSNYTS